MGKRSRCKNPKKQSTTKEQNLSILEEIAIGIRKRLAEDNCEGMCVEVSILFAEIANKIGYNAKIITGIQVFGNKFGSFHSWNEVDGKTFDIMGDVNEDRFHVSKVGKRVLIKKIDFI